MPVEHFRSDGLHEMRVEAGLLRAQPLVRLPPAREGDHVGVLAPGFLADAPGHFVAADLGHPEIEDHDVGPELLGDGDGGLTVERVPDVVPRDLEQDRQALGRVAVVVHDQDPARRGGRTRRGDRRRRRGRRPPRSAT